MRIIVATPDPVECEVLASWLAADGFEPIKKTTLAAAADAVQNNDFDLFIADFTFAFRYRLHSVSRKRIRNIKTPTVVIGDLDVATQTREDRRAMYLPRPVDRANLMCLVSMAVLDGRPVRCSPRKSIDALDAIVNGVRAHIIDLSNEGIRLAIPRAGLPSPPPVFNVRVPMIGATLTVKRMWARTQPTQPGLLLCGGSVIARDVGGEIGWRVLVDSLPSRGDTSLSLEQRD